MRALKDVILFSFRWWLLFGVEALSAWNEYVEKTSSVSRVNSRVFPLVSTYYVLRSVLLGATKIGFRAGSIFFFLGALGLADIPEKYSRLISHTQVATAVGGLACQQFNPNEWELGYGLLTFDGSTLQVVEGVGGGLLRWEREVPLNASVKITVIPESEKQFNFVVLMHDLYEMNIGDGDYRGITLKVAGAKGQPMKRISTTEGEDRVVFPMDRGGDVTVVLDQWTSALDDGSMMLVLQVAKTTFFNGDPTPPKEIGTWRFPLPSQIRHKDVPGKLSIGLNSASDGTRVAAEIVCVDIAPR
jgi:hypothetical protein